MPVAGTRGIGKSNMVLNEYKPFDTSHVIQDPKRSSKVQASSRHLLDLPSTDDYCLGKKDLDEKMRAQIIN